MMLFASCRENIYEQKNDDDRPQNQECEDLSDETEY